MLLLVFLTCFSVVSNAQQVKLKTKPMLTLEVAKAISEMASDYARKNGWNVVITIVDDGGHMVYMERMDGVQTGSLEVAIQKAETAAAFFDHFTQNQYPGQYSLAGYTFKNRKGKYGIEINTVSEVDGECTYKVLVNGKLVSEVQNKASEDDWTVQTLNCGTVKLKPGDVISVAFNSHTNGKIPEGETTAYARGRWTRLKLSPVCK